MQENMRRWTLHTWLKGIVHDTAGRGLHNGTDMPNTSNGSAKKLATLSDGCSALCTFQNHHGRFAFIEDRSGHNLAVVVTTQAIEQSDNRSRSTKHAELKHEQTPT
jgi:hypothetical protein